MLTYFVLMMALAIVGVAIWPPFILMYVSSEDLRIYARLAAATTLVPRYGILQIQTCFHWVLFCTAAILHAINAEAADVPDAFFTSCVCVAFVYITAAQYLRVGLLYHHCPFTTTLLAVFLLAASATLAALYAVRHYWPSMGLMIGVAVYDMYLVFMSVEWWLAHLSTRTTKRPTAAVVTILSQ